MAQTKLTNLVDPQVMADMISGKLAKKIRFAPFATIDTTLSGNPGSTITVPKYAYIGDADDVAEGVAMEPALLTATTSQVKVKKAGKAVELTDEALLSEYGSPLDEAAAQIALAIAAKVDVDCYAALLAGTQLYDGSSATISYDGLVNAADVFLEEGDMPESKAIFVNPKQVTQLRLDPQFRDINKYPIQTTITGVIGTIAGIQIVPSRKVVATEGIYKCPMIMLSTPDQTGDETPALTIYLKRDINVESDRDVLAKTTVISADEHYACSLSNDAKAVVASFKEE